jgi:hypothetical protein
MLALLLAAAVAGTPAKSARPATEAKAEVDVKAKDVFTEAKKLFSQKKYAEAIVKFQEAYGIAAHPVILYNIAKCHERMGEPALALRNFREYARLDAKAAADPVVKGDIANGERRLREKGIQQLVVFADPPTARISVDGNPLTPSPAYVELKAGPHVLNVTAEGYEPEERAITIDLRRIAEMTVTLRTQTPDVPLAAAGTEPVEGTENKLVPKREITTQRVVIKPSKKPMDYLGTMIAGGATLVAGGVATGFGVSYNGLNTKLHTLDESRETATVDKLRAETQSAALATNVAIGVAGAAAVTTIVLFILENR